jgi:hypothetical protein
VTALDLTGARLSSAVVCPRQSWYQHIGAEETQIDGRDQELLEWRRAQNDLVVGEYAAALRAEGHDVHTELAISWLDGQAEGHADLVDFTDGVVAEFTGTAGADLPERKVLQATAYAHLLGLEAAVVSFDPSSGTKRAYPIDMDAKRPDAVAAMEAVARAIETGEPPERVCSTPNDQPARWCRFRDSVCMPQFLWPDPEAIDDPEVIELAAELADAIDEKGLKKRDFTAADERVTALKEQLAARVEHGVALVAGGVSLKVTDVAGRETLSLGDMRKAGVSLPDELAPFVKRGEGYWKIDERSVKRIA